MVLLVLYSVNTISGGRPGLELGGLAVAGSRRVAAARSRGGSGGRLGCSAAPLQGRVTIDLVASRHAPMPAAAGSERRIRSAPPGSA
jgi:hypothetical protein